MAAKRFLVLVTVFVFLSYADSLKLPSYFKACSRNDPDISACVLRNGKVSFTQLVKKGGDRKYNTPNLSPLLITELKVDQTGLKLTMKDIKLNGIEDAQLTSAKVDFKAKHEEFELLIPRVEILCTYTINGRLLILPIQGTGPANFTIPNLRIQFSHDYDLVKGKTGKDHMVTKNAVTTLRKSPGFIQLENLFGNKELSDQTNLILNENSEEVIGDVGTAVAEAIGLVVEQIYNGLTSVVPFDEMYPEKV